MNYRRTTARALERIARTAGTARISRADLGLLELGPAFIAIAEQERLARTAWVHLCRENGHTWQQIADALGISRQAVQQNYATKLADRPMI